MGKTILFMETDTPGTVLLGAGIFPTGEKERHKKDPIGAGFRKRQHHFTEGNTRGKTGRLL